MQSVPPPSLCIFVYFLSTEEKGRRREKEISLSFFSAFPLLLAINLMSCPVRSLPSLSIGTVCLVFWSISYCVRKSDKIELLLLYYYYYVVLNLGLSIIYWIYVESSMFRNIYCTFPIKTKKKGKALQYAIRSWKLNKFNEYRSKERKESDKNSRLKELYKINVSQL